MQLAVACGKMETEREKVIPFGLEVPEEEEECGQGQDGQVCDEDLSKVT